MDCIESGFFHFRVEIYYSQNNIGSTTLLTNKDGSDIGQFLYTPYGEMWVEEASTVDISHITRFFTNQQYDKESGLYYYNARYYDPHLGSFITPDPSMSGLNHYNYANSNPIKYTDPSGLASVSMDAGMQKQREAKIAGMEWIKRHTANFDVAGGGGEAACTVLRSKTTSSPSISYLLTMMSLGLSYSSLGSYSSYISSSFSSSFGSGSSGGSYSNTPDITGTETITESDVTEESQNDGGNEPLKLTEEQKVDYLLQMVKGAVKYPSDCKFFGVVNSFLDKGIAPTVKTNDLAEYVHKKVSAKNYKIGYTTVVKDVFGLDTTLNPIPTGLDTEGLKKLTGENPTILHYSQKDFWGSDKLKGEHGVSFYNGNFRDPYRGNFGAFSNVRGTKSTAKSSKYLGGYYFTW